MQINPINRLGGVGIPNFRTTSGGDSSTNADPNAISRILEGLMGGGVPTGANFDVSHFAPGEMQDPLGDLGMSAPYQGSEGEGLSMHESEQNFLAAQIGRGDKGFSDILTGLAMTAGGFLGLNVNPAAGATTIGKGLESLMKEDYYQPNSWSLAEPAAFEPSFEPGFDLSFSSLAEAAGYGGDSDFGGYDNSTDAYGGDTSFGGSDTGGYGTGDDSGYGGDDGGGYSDSNDSF